VSLLGQLSPVVAIILGWVIAGQAMTPVQMVGLALVLVALVTGQTGGRPKCGDAIAQEWRPPLSSGSMEPLAAPAAR